MMRFRLTPRSMTFDDLDASNSLGISLDFVDLVFESQQL